MQALFQRQDALRSYLPYKSRQMVLQAADN
jgi:hypothetical protein